MNIPISYAKWSASNLPAGLKIKNGIISGTPTAEVGSYEVPFTVRTPWGTDTKNININVREKAKFAIYQNGEKLEDIYLSDLIASIRNGTAQEKYNCTNTQIMIPITTPALNYDYEENRELYMMNRPSQIDMAAVNFCSFRNVTLQDGTVKPGLILQFDKTLWGGYCCFDTGDSAGQVKHASYYDNDDTLGYVCNRWKYSTLRQWLNSSGTNWFTKAYDTDGFLSIPDVDTVTRINKYGFDLYSKMRDENSIGFLSILPDDLLEAIQPIRIQTQAHFDEDNFDETLEEPEIINDVYVDVTYDKIFIPSLEEMNIQRTYDEDYESAIDGIEGTAWEYYLNKFGSEARYSGGSSFDGMDEFGLSLIPDSDNLKHVSRGQFTRSATLNTSNCFFVIYFYEYDKKFSVDAIRAQFETYGQPAPAFVLC